LRDAATQLLIVLHIWTAVEVYEVIQDYGWFYGDFFLEKHHTASLKYTGIYRYAAMNVGTGSQLRQAQRCRARFSQ